MSICIAGNQGRLGLLFQGEPQKKSHLCSSFLHWAVLEEHNADVVAVVEHINTALEILDLITTTWIIIEFLNTKSLFNLLFLFYCKIP